MLVLSSLFRVGSALSKFKSSTSESTLVKMSPFVSSSRTKSPLNSRAASAVFSSAMVVSKFESRSVVCDSVVRSGIKSVWRSIVKLSNSSSSFKFSRLLNKFDAAAPLIAVPPTAALPGLKLPSIISGESAVMSSSMSVCNLVDWSLVCSLVS